MSVPVDNLEELQKELQWIKIKKEFEAEKPSGIKAVYKYLVPIGVLATTGVLGTGIYYMLKRDSRKQQKLMRYRVLAQGVTVGIATLGLFHVKLSS